MKDSKKTISTLGTVLYIISAVAFLSYFLTNSTYSLVIGALLLIAGSYCIKSSRSR